jgi:ABC-type multidrug transport system fused ATPase/permease subunit
MTDGLSTLYQDLLGGSYDCVDRIVLNAYFRMGHDPGGFRVRWRALTGSDETLENARPLFRERNLITAGVTARLAESLAGIRVVKAYRAERREGAVFANGVQRLLPGSVSAGHWISRANPTS